MSHRGSLRPDREAARSFTAPAAAPAAGAGDIFMISKNNIQMATVGINDLFGMH